MKSAVALALVLLLGSCAHSPSHLDRSALIGAWFSAPVTTWPGRYDENCSYNDNGTFSCMATKWGCPHCQGESYLISGSWDFRDGRFQRAISSGVGTGTRSSWAVLGLEGEALLLSDNLRWFRTESARTHYVLGAP
ncbi:hypothetical protein GCM10027430_28900 [Lysobacter tyrosinilyticus]